MQSEYQFVENKYPTRDPNSDIDFDSKLTYNYLTGNSKLLNKQTNDIVQYEDGKQVYNTTIKKAKQEKTNKANSYEVVLSIICLLIAVLFIWNIYKRDNRAVYVTKFNLSSITDDIDMFNPHIWKE